MLIVVGFELLAYPTTEDDGTVRLCVITYPASPEPAPREFDLAINTTDGTAGLFIWLVCCTV